MKLLFPFLLSVLLLSSCVKNNPDPAWLEVGEWQLLENLNGNPAGELTENISDAWVFIDDKFIGVFEVPFRIPVLVEGIKKITLYPTILNNGISATKKVYPFLEPYTIEGEMIKNEVLTVNPETKYKDDVQFTIIDFEGSLNFEESPSSTANIYASNDPAIIQAFNGNLFGRVDLNSTNFNWIAATNLDKDLPAGQEVYLEVDYYTTADILTGVLAINSQETKENPNVQINKQDANSVEWKKIYIDLKIIVSGSTSAEYFEHSFESALTDGATSGQINIDNIKVVHF